MASHNSSSFKDQQVGKVGDDVVDLMEIIGGNDTNMSLYNNSGNTSCWNDYCMDEDDYLDYIRSYIEPTPYEWFFILLYFVTFLVGLVGNALVCFAVFQNQNMRTVTNVFIVNLAVGDFMVILICLPPSLVHDVTETWFLGTGVCKVILYFQSASVSVSVLTLSAIAVERWWAICYPLKFKSTLSRAQKIIVLIWVLALVWALPEVIVAETKPFEDFPPRFKTVLFTVCGPGWSSLSTGIYQLIIALMFFVFPMALMAFTYTNIVRVLWTNDIPGDVMRGRKPMLDGNRNSQEEQILSRRKAARMLIAIVIVFGICYLPVHLLNVFRYFKLEFFHPRDTDGPVIQSLVSHWLPYFNSALNPVIYNFMSDKFRKEFKTTCFCCVYGTRTRPFRGRRDRPFTMTFTNSNYSNCHTEEVTMASYRGMV